MDTETLFTASKWEILKCLEREPASPLALSKACRTSIANVSQQLRLLEMAGVVTSERVPNRDKGKPRVLYSLAGNLSYLIATADSFVDKKVLSLSELNKVVMRIWFCEKVHLRYTLEKAFWKIEQYFDRIAYLAFDLEGESPITFLVKSRGKPLDIRPFTVTDEHGKKRQIVFAKELKTPYTLHTSIVVGGSDEK